RLHAVRVDRELRAELRLELREAGLDLAVAHQCRGLLRARRVTATARGCDDYHDDGTPPHASELSACARRRARTTPRARAPVRRPRRGATRARSLRSSTRGL